LAPAIPVYDVYALKYAERAGRRPDHFVGGDPHDVPMPMDYFIWVIRNDERLVLVDTASDASHYYEHFELNTCFPTTLHLGEVLEGYAKLRRLAASPAHIVPGHDPLVMQRYPAINGLEGIGVRLDAEPSK
jgi:hypothetical protein